MRLKPHPCWAALAAILLTNLTYAAPRPAAHAAGGAGTPRPKLIFMIVIDQFRADYLTRFEKRFLPPRSQGGDVGGFRYLMTQGAYYPFAQYDLLQSMTCPGHATVLTGAYPYQAGIPANDWFDPETLQRVYCAEDPTQATVGAETTDPHLGTSPKNLIADTVGDELKNAGIPSRVVTVALKDRAAIMMGGHRADLALWMDPGSHHWVSSKFYLPDGKLPGWVVHLNETLDQHKGEAITWDYPGPGSGLSTEKYFPHKADFGTRESMAMPLGVDLTETAAERAFEAFKLGQGAGTDLFAVSFSSHDYVGHQFGPNSREMEEMTVAEDFAISQLLNMVREKVPGGLKNTVVILTGDHGIPPIPETAQAARIEAGRIDDIGLTKQMNGKLNERHGKPAMGEWIGFVHDFNFFLNRKAAAEKKIELAELEAEIKDMLLPVPGVAFVFTGADYAIRKLPPGMHERQAIHTYYPGRSGEVMLIPKPFWIRNEDRDTHLTGYSYDRSVPLAIAGFGIRPGIYANRADVIDIAPTLSFLSGVLAPALSEGRVLSEAVDTGALK